MSTPGQNPNYNAQKTFVKNVNNFLTTYFGTNINVKRLKKTDIEININNKTNITDLLTNFNSDNYNTLIENNVYNMNITPNMIKPNTNGNLTQNQTLLSAIKRVKGLLNTLFEQIKNKTTEIITNNKKTLEDIITNIPRNENNLNQLKIKLTDYSVLNLKKIIDFQKIYTNEIQEKIFFILNITNNQSKQSPNNNMMVYIQTILTNYIRGIKNYYIILYINLYNKKLSELLSNISPDDIITNFSDLKTNILNLLNDNNLITDNTKRNNFLTIYNKFIVQLEDIKNLNKNINSIITDLKTELINTYSAFLESKNNSGTNYIPQNKRRTINNQNLNIKNPFNGMKLNNNKSNINTKIKDKAEILMESIQSKINEYTDIKKNIIDLIKTIKNNLQIAINKKSFININSSSFQNFKSKINVLKNNSQITLSELNNTNFKVKLNELNTLLKELIGTDANAAFITPLGKSSTGTGSVPQPGLQPGNTSVPVSKTYAISKPSMFGTSTKKNFTKDELINLLNNKIERTKQSNYKQKFINLLNKLKRGNNLTNNELTQLTLTQNEKLKGGLKK